MKLQTKISWILLMVHGAISNKHLSHLAEQKLEVCS